MLFPFASEVRIKAYDIEQQSTKKKQAHASCQALEMVRGKEAGLTLKGLPAGGLCGAEKVLCLACGVGPTKLPTIK